MSSATDELCVACNGGAGELCYLDIVGRDGRKKHFELVLCPDCLGAFREDELTTVTAPAEQRVSERRPSQSVE